MSDDVVYVQPLTNIKWSESFIKTIRFEEEEEEKKNSCHIFFTKSSMESHERAVKSHAWSRGPHRQRQGLLFKQCCHLLIHSLCLLFFASATLRRGKAKSGRDNATR